MEEVFKDNNITYEIISDTEVRVNRAPEEIAACIIPDCVTYNDKQYKVTSIGDWAFYGCCLTSITLPATLTSIGYEAFRDCSKLRKVTCRTKKEPLIGEFCFDGGPNNRVLVIGKDINVNLELWGRCKALRK